MPTNAYASQADLETGLGGPSVLLQLADFGNTGSLADVGVQAVIVDYLETGAARVRAAAEVKHDPETLDALDTASKRLLVAWNVDLSVRIAWEKGARGQAVPQRVAERAERTERDLDRLADGHLRLGRVAGGTVAAINQPAESRDPDPDLTGLSINAFRATGFR